MPIEVVEWKAEGWVLRFDPKVRKMKYSRSEPIQGQAKN
jgi:hypothetical protein